MTDTEDTAKTKVSKLPPLQQPKASIASESSKKPNSFKKIIGIIVLCVTSSVFTTWVLLVTGLIRPDATQTITENREKIVLQEGEIITDVFKKVSPSTVAITTESMGRSSSLFESDVREGAGSGFIISKDGYVLTNKHVVPEGTAKVTVVLADGRELTNVKVVGRDPSNDIAFLKIEGESSLPAAEIGDSNTVEPGQKVVAVGNALGEFRNSVTSGIISGLGRPIVATADELTGSSEKLENLFQTDAAINPGNSGGPLVNLKGEVVGINTAVAQEAQGIGFAIPINDAKALITSITTQGKIIRSYLGVRYLALNADNAKELNLSVSRGAYIRGNREGPGVIEGGPAFKAGLKEGDIVVKVENTEISENKSLSSALASYSPNSKVNLTIMRDGKEQKVAVTLEAYPGL